MEEPRSYRTPPLANASNVVPVGVHLASDGSIVLDPPDEALIADLRDMIAAFARNCPTGGTRVERRVRNSVSKLTLQRDAMADVLKALLEQMGDADTGRSFEPQHMLASTFDRFGQFADFATLAAGCGDASVDPLHEDAELAAEVQQSFGLGAGGRS